MASLEGHKDFVSRLVAPHTRPGVGVYGLGPEGGTKQVNTGDDLGFSWLIRVNAVKGKPPIL